MNKVHVQNVARVVTETQLHCDIFEMYLAKPLENYKLIYSLRLSSTDIKQ